MQAAVFACWQQVVQIALTAPCMLCSDAIQSKVRTHSNMVQPSLDNSPYHVAHAVSCIHRAG